MPEQSLKIHVRSMVIPRHVIAVPPVSTTPEGAASRENNIAQGWEYRAGAVRSRVRTNPTAKHRRVQSGVQSRAFSRACAS